MLGKSVLDDGVLVRGIVVCDQMQRLILGCFAVDLFEERQSLDVGMALAWADDLAIEDIERSEQRGGAVSFVIVSHCLRPPLLERQSWLRAIERLDLTFLVAAQHQRMLRRRHVQADDGFEFLDELRIARHLEGFDPMRLEAMGPPHRVHRGHQKCRAWRPVCACSSALRPRALSAS